MITTISGFYSRLWLVLGLPPVGKISVFQQGGCADSGVVNQIAGTKPSIQAVGKRHGVPVAAKGDTVPDGMPSDDLKEEFWRVWMPVIVCIG